MEELQKKELDQLLSLVARLALFVFDEVEPTTSTVLEADLEDLYAWLVRVERRVAEYSGPPGPGRD